MQGLFEDSDICGKGMAKAAKHRAKFWPMKQK
jgi:hypothetical protein